MNKPQTYPNIGLVRVSGRCAQIRIVETFVGKNAFTISETDGGNSVQGRGKGNGFGMNAIIDDNGRDLIGHELGAHTTHIVDGISLAKHHMSVDLDVRGQHAHFIVQVIDCLEKMLDMIIIVEYGTDVEITRVAGLDCLADK